MTHNQIDTLSITELLGKNFYIPEYQRGYRWTRTNVLQLLNDIWEYRQETTNVKSFYCLQPVVVKEHTWKDLNGNDVNGYELIDGQQRLTTIHRIIIYLMLEYLKTESLAGDYKNELYNIYYKTRLESKTFLASNAYDSSKPDLYYMSEAYRCIKEWFEEPKKGFGRAEKNRFLDVLLPEIVVQNDDEQKKYPEWSVQVIWYKINDADQKSEHLFTRLNRGKIPLTSAELVKAKFVNKESFKGIPEDNLIKRRTQLIQIWDEIESQLNNPKFWAFISNESINKYSNKIEYLFDIITDKKASEKDPLFSFLHFFNEKETSTSLWQKWIDVEEIYRSLVYWYSNKDFYHKIGYLIATGTSINKLVAVKKNHTKTHFQNELNELIASTIPNNWEDLSYDNRSEHEKMINVLLLANIELTRMNDNNNEFFPFEIYKNITKSLEHVHAQNIVGINENKREEWFSWLSAHTSILLNITKDVEKAKKLIKEFNAIDREKYKYEDFKVLSEKILNLIPTDESNENEYLHKIKNMALLGLAENISLSNSVFEVKRRKIIEMDRNGAFIPLATKRVFLKYYANDSSHHYSIWTAHEREAYQKELQICIEQYKPINAEVK